MCLRTIYSMRTHGSSMNETERPILPTAYWPSLSWMSALVHRPEAAIETGERFEKQSFRNRCSISGPNGRMLLVIPLKHESLKQSCEQRISYAENWRKVHLKAFESAYGKTPFFLFLHDELTDLYSNKYEYLVEWNRATIQLLCTWFQIGVPVEHRSAECVPSLPEIGNCAPPVKLSSYPQLFEHRHGFLENLSSIDLLASEGPAAYSVLLGR